MQGESHFMDAARAAAVAGTGLSGDEPSPSPAERTKLRGMALNWMRADLDGWYRRFGPGREETRRRAAKYYRRFMEDPSVAGVRNAAELAMLPAVERDAWREFWHEVDTRILVAPEYRSRGERIKATSALYDRQIGLMPK
jgi:hypothetical protein